MNYMECFLSERTLELHDQYLNTLRLRYSIWEESIPEIKGRSLLEISRMRIPEKRDLIYLACEMRFHELYFSSFGVPYQRSSAIRKCYSSEASFIYDMYTDSIKSDEKILIGYAERRKVAYVLCDYDGLLGVEHPLFAVDLCEHAYFLDYGFDKGEYLQNSLRHLEFFRIDKFLSSKD